MLSGERAIHHRHVTIKNACAFHAVTFDTHEVDMRRADVQKLVDGNVLLEVIGSR
ncbi:hypothetical protein D3C72_2369900 [compost metagenome]